MMLEPIKRTIAEIYKEVTTPKYTGRKHKDLTPAMAKVKCALQLTEINIPKERIAIFFKFTCQHCHYRNAFLKPDTIEKVGHCRNCHKDTQITRVGWAMVLLDDSADGNDIKKLQEYVESTLPPERN